jgi:predicted MFS family arabinose efflux permease
VLVVGLLVWGFGAAMVPVAVQQWAARAEPRQAESAVALAVAAFQVAITAGSVGGGLLVDGPGVRAALLVGAGLGALAALGFAATRLPARD